MKLSELVSAFPSLPELPDAEIRKVTADSREAANGTVFVCVRGARNDGHLYAADAYRNGCRVFVSERRLELPPDAAVIPVDDSKAALAELCRTFYRDPSSVMTLTGITGTKGKTTVAGMIRHILERNGISCGYIGTNGISYLNRTAATANTTPDAPTLQKTLADMRDSGIRNAVIEVSSQSVLTKRIDGTKFFATVFTNLSPDHIGVNEHPDFENYRECKHRLFTSHGSAVTVFNSDDPASVGMLKNATARQPVSCSTTDPGADYFADEIVPYRTDRILGSRFTLHCGKELFSCVLPLIGRINVSNALLAVAVARHVYGVPTDAAIHALADVRIAGRSEIVPLSTGATAVIDYAHNGESLSKILTSLHEYRPERLIAVFGSVGGRTEMRRAELGRAAAELADLCVLTSDNPGEEEPLAIIRDIAKEFTGTNTPYLEIPDRADAIRQAVALSRPGDILLLAGKGHEAYQLIGKEKIPFREIDYL